MSLALLFAVSVYARPLEVSDGEVFLDSVMSIQEVSVVGKKHAEIIKPQTLSGVQLSRLNSQTVADALRYFSGVQLKDYGGIGGIKTVNIRSMGTNHVGVFYNGIQLGNAQNGQVDLGRYSLDNIEEISLYNGQKSNIFQSAKDFASSSAIYIYTKRPTFAPGKNYQVMVQMKTGSFGLANPSVVWNQRLSDNVTMSANAEYTYANGKYKFHYRRLQLNGDVAYDTTATRQNGDVEAVRAELGVYGRLRDGRWNINGYFYTSQRGIPGAIVNNVFRRGERQWDKSAFGQGAFEKKFSNVYSLKISGKFAWDYSRYLRDDEKELYLNNHYYQKEVYVSVANLFAITDWWNVSASADLQWNAMDADLVDFAYPTRWTELGAIATAVTLGRFNAQASLLGTFIQESARSRKAYTAGPNRHELSPAVFVNYSPFDSDWFEVYGFFKKIFRMPTFNDLYYTEMGNANLEPEYTYQYDMGFSVNRNLEHTFFDFVGVKADAYYNYVTNKIIAYPTGKQFRWTMINLGKVRIAGLEVSGDVAAHIGKVNMKLHSQYTFQRARDYTDPSDSFYGDQIPYIPRHSVSVSYNANYRGWDFNYSFIYTGKRYNEQENNLYNFEPPWYTHDLSLSKELNVGQVRLRIVGELNNVFNQDYEVIHNYPMPGRNFRITAKLTI
ncbi:MAG TPA: TonB-dependent receptor [Candidatus Avimuribaculum pullicola]|nr:TonB-dependent receptor [Candidatus Avimuribaculum pullicola]